MAKIIESIQTRRTRVELIVLDLNPEVKKSKSEEKLEHLRNSFLRALFISPALFTILLLFIPARTVHFTCTVHHFANVPSCCLFDALAVSHDFCFFPFGPYNS